ALRESLAALPGQEYGGLKVIAADDFSYTDPIDESVSTAQGVRVMFADDSRIVYRLSGTGTQGATLRVYLERYSPPGGRHDQDPQEALSDLIAISRSLAGIEARLGRAAPDVIT
ncbi:MAG: alpha-D-glucose phosphate-specific phosphoglucomutase, partial [Rhodospirillales bacterium]|nr:alpha-D-glucose phosphate-specific phosphoglucomutase [Rhodospirillales bacterium]